MEQQHFDLSCAKLLLARRRRPYWLIAAYQATLSMAVSSGPAADFDKTAPAAPRRAAGGQPAQSAPRSLGETAQLLTYTWGRLKVK
jgi:hypothetical protein